MNHRFLSLVMRALALVMLILPLEARAFDAGAWDQLLKRHVRVIDGGKATTVDYDGFARDKAALSAWLKTTEQVSRAEFNGWSKAERLAFLINVYNARTVELVLTGWPGIDSIKDLGGVLSTPWSIDFVPLMGKTVSLDDIEHGMIRGSGQFNDPRIHFAVNCASIGCPALRAEAFVASRLDDQLEDQTRLFLADRSRNRLKGGRLDVSMIFKWYREDFEAGFRKARKLESFLAVYGDALGLDAAQTAALAAGDLPIGHLTYDWRLNAAR